MGVLLGGIRNGELEEWERELKWFVRTGFLAEVDLWLQGMVRSKSTTDGELKTPLMEIRTGQ